MTFDWDAVANNGAWVTYEVRWRQVGAGPYTTVTGINSSEWTLDLIGSTYHGKQYEFQLRAVNLVGSTASWSAWVQTVVIPS